MITLALTALPLLWIVWLTGMVINPVLVGWVGPLSKLIVGIGLCGMRVPESPPLQRCLRSFGLTFLLLALADSCWTLAFPAGTAKMGDTFWILWIYLASAAVGVWASLGFFAYMRSLFGFSACWFRVPLGVSLLLGVFSFWLGAPQLSGYSTFDLWAFWLNIALGMLGSFATAVLVGLGIATWGGSFFRWVAPAALGFILILVANTVYVDQGESYSAGSLTEWLYLLGTSVFFIYLPWPARATRSPAVQEGPA